jgi:hypothetical protein
LSFFIGGKTAKRDIRERKGTDPLTSSCVVPKKSVCTNMVARERTNLHPLPKPVRFHKAGETGSFPGQRSAVHPCKQNTRRTPQAIPQNYQTKRREIESPGAFILWGRPVPTQKLLLSLHIVTVVDDHYLLQSYRLLFFLLHLLKPRKGCTGERFFFKLSKTRIRKAHKT